MGVPQPSRLPLFYFGVAHLSLAAAGLTLALEPTLLSGFFYQSPMMASVHLVTLGWISGSILGALYMVAPMALGGRLVESWLDKVSWFLFLLGFTGMASHFWLDSWNGMLWSTWLVVGSVLFVGVRTHRALRRARVDFGVRLHVNLAFLNVAMAAGLGMLLAYNKMAEPLLTIRSLDGVYAHFHLAALGWATMMVMGVGYRLVPMLLPSAMPGGLASVTSALSVEIGVLGLAASFLWRPALRGPFALCAALGVVVFLARIVRLLAQRRPPARGLPRPDFGLMHVAQAMLYLVLAMILGLVLVFEVPGDEVRIRLIPVYAVLTLLGFLAQMILGVTARLLPLHAWFRSFAARGGTQPPAPPYSVTRQGLLAVVLILWTTATPLLAAGLYLESAPVVAAAGGTIVTAALVAAVHWWSVFRRASEA